MSAEADKREKVAAHIRALRAKTVENGCTEAEALAAAELLAKLLERHNMSVDEAELRETPFQREHLVQDDWVGQRLWKVADGISHMTGVRYWMQRPGCAPSIDFFGFSHEVEIARYLLEICAGAMTRELRRILAEHLVHARGRRAAIPYLDGMADRLRERLRAMKPTTPPGKGLIVLHGALIDKGLKDIGVQLRDQRAPRSRDMEEGYRDGRAAGDRVSLNPGLNGRASSSGMLK